MILKSLMYQDAKHMLKNFQIKNLKDMQNLKKKFVFSRQKSIFPAAISEEHVNENKFPMDLWCHLKVRWEMAVPI